jgi:hypothetical protein
MFNGLKNLLLGRPAGGRKATTMAGETTTPPAPGGLDLTALSTAIGAAVAEANKPLLEQLSKLQSPAAPATPTPTATAGGAGGGDKPKFLTAEDLVRVLDARDQTRQTADARRSFASDKLKDLPPGYESRLGNDPAKWPAEEQQLRTEYRAFLDKQGIKVPDVGGGAAADGTKKPGEVVDLSKMSTIDKMVAGLKEAPVQGPQSLQTRTQPAAGAAGAQ